MTVITNLLIAIKNWFQDLTPIFVEESKVPVILSYVAPLDIGAISIFPFVFSRYPKGELSERTRRHETIHHQQTMELLIVGHVIVYLFDWIRGLIKYRNDWENQDSPRGLSKYQSAGNKAYYRTRSEQEAYDNELDEDYLTIRKRYTWLFKYSV